MEKKRKKLEEMKSNFFGYSNGAFSHIFCVAFNSLLLLRCADTNPFNDSNLTEAFVWKKKFEQQGLQRGTDLRKIVNEKAKKEAAIFRDEIEKVKKRREERALEKAQMEQMRVQVERDQAMTEWVELDKKEEEFHQKQVC